MRRHLLLLTFTLILSHFSILNLWAGEQYIFPVTSASTGSGGTLGTDANGMWYYEITDADDYIDIPFTVDQSRECFIYVGYTTAVSGAELRLSFYRYDTYIAAFGNHGVDVASTITEKNCGAQLDATDIDGCKPYKLRVQPSPTKAIRVYYLKVVSTDGTSQSTASITAADLNFVPSSTVGDNIVSNSDFLYSHKKEDRIKVQNKVSQDRITFTNGYVTAASRKLYTFETGTYKFKFNNVFTEENTTYDKPYVYVNNVVAGGGSYYFNKDDGGAGGNYRDFEVEINVTAGTYPIAFIFPNTNEKWFFTTVTVTKAAVSCANYSFHYGIDGQAANTWRMECFEYSGAGSVYYVNDFTIPEAEDATHFYVGYQGSFYNDKLGYSKQSRSKTRRWHETNADVNSNDHGEMYFAAPIDNGNLTVHVGQAAGAKGKIRINDDSNWNNLRCTFVPDGYVLKVGSSEYPFTLESGNEYRSGLVELSSTNARDAVSVGIENEDGDYVATDNSEGRQHLFLDVTTNWSGDNAKFVLYDVTHSSFTCAMTQVPGNDKLYEGWVPADCSTVIFVRRADNTLSFDNKWNQTGDLTLESGKNYFTITDWGVGTWSTYEKKGKFSITDNINSKNWGVHFYPYNVLTYDANGGSGAPDEQSVAIDAVSKSVTVAAGSGMTAPTGYEFNHWDTQVGDDGTDYAAGASYTLSADATLYAQWTAKQSTITFDKEGGSSGSDGATGTYGSAMPSITAPTRTGYDFGGYWDGDDGTGTQYYKADGTSERNWDKDTEDGTTLYAKWTVKSYTVTLYTNDGTINAGDVTSYTYGVGATLPTNVTKSDNRFMGWYDNSSFTGSPVTTISTSATENKEYWARWATLYTITNGNPSNGTINVNSTAIEGETVSILATPSSGYAFNEWSIYKTGDASTAISPASVAAATSFTMPAYGVTVTATFEEEECFSGLVIQCEDYIDYTKEGSGTTNKPSGSTDHYPSNLGSNSSTSYGTPSGGYFAEFKGSDKSEMWMPVTLPEGSFSFTVRGGHLTTMWFNLYNASTGEKLQFNKLQNSWEPNFITRTTSSYELSAGDYIIGLYGDNEWSAFDQVEIVKQSDAPCAAPTAPTYPECNVMSVYSPHYETNVGLTYANWGGSTTNQTPEDVLGEKVLKVTTNSSYTYFGLEFGCASTGVDVSSYSTVEFDVWTPVATSFRFFPINRNSSDSGNDTEYSIDVTTSASIWKHISIDVSAYTGQGLGMNRVYQFKLDQISQQTTLWLTNFIFYDADAACATKHSVTMADDGNGSAVADEDEYELNATVTLTATPDIGYAFSSWTITKTSDGTDVTASVGLSGTSTATFTMPDYDVTVTANFVARALITTPTVEAESGIYEDPINISLEATSYQYSHPVVVFFVSDGTTTYEVTGAPYGSAGNSLGSIGAAGVDYQTVHKATFTATKAATYTVIAKLYEGELVDNFETENFRTWGDDNAGTGGAVTYEDNSSKTAVNGSNQVLKIYCASDAADWGGAVLRFIAKEDRCLGKDYDYLHVRMKDATSNSKLKISDSEGSWDDIAPSLGSEAGDWKNVTYARGERCKFDFLLFMINRGGSGGGTVYIDDVILSNESSMTIKATSSSASVAIAKVFTGDGADANWNTTANWSDGAVSTINDVVYIRKPAVINVTNAKAKSIILDQSSSYTGSIEIQSGKELVIATTLKKTTDGSAMIATGVNDVFINSDASNGLGALVMGTHDGTNKATVNFYTLSHGSSGSDLSVNQYVGTPFNDETNILYNWYNSWVYGIVYDGSGNIGWRRVNEGQGMTPFKGYTVISADPAGHSYWQQGTLNATTDQTISGLNWQSGSGAANENNENLLANSWMAPIKIAAMQSTDFVRTDATIYIFNSTSPDGYKSGGFASNYTTYTVGTAGQTDIIPAMQSFSVFTNASGGSSVILDYSKIVYDPAVAGTVPAANRAPQRRTSAEEANKLRLFVSAESGYGDMVYMWERSDFAEGFENGWDGRKVFGEPVAPQLYAVTPDGNMAVNCVPDFEGTLLGFQAGTSANSYTFTFEYTDEAEELYLRDMDTNAFTRVMNGNSYTFTTSDRTSHNRFVLTKNAPQSPTDIAETGDGLPITGARKVIINDHVYILRGGRMYSIEGRVVKSE